MTTAIIPNGAISKIISVTVPLTIDTEMFRTRAVRDVIYIISLLIQYNLLYIRAKFSENDPPMNNGAGNTK
jgi:ribonuclease D